MISFPKIIMKQFTSWAGLSFLYLASLQGCRFPTRESDNHHFLKLTPFFEKTYIPAMTDECKQRKKDLYLERKKDLYLEREKDLYLEKNDGVYEYTETEFREDLSTLLGTKLTESNYAYKTSEYLKRPYGFYLDLESGKILLYTQSDSVLNKRIVHYSTMDAVSREEIIHAITDKQAREIVEHTFKEIEEKEKVFETAEEVNLWIKRCYFNPKSFDTWACKFFSPVQIIKRGWPVILGMLGRSQSTFPTREEIEREIPVVRRYDFDEREMGVSIMWLGHATCLVRLNGVNILTDPVWYAKAGIFGKIGSKRHVEPPYPISQLPEIHLVLLSHNHYDHLDGEAVQELISLFPSAKWLTPIRIGDFVRDYGAKYVYEMGWGEEKSFATIGVSIDVTAVPAQHWGCRTGYDIFGSQWCGWMVSVKGKTFYFTGDTGFCRKEFLKMGRKFDIDVAAIPIGCYEPSDFLYPQHISPSEAVALYEMTNAKHALAIHWGTYDMGSTEHFFQPKADLQESLTKRGGITGFEVRNPGELWIVS